MAKLPEVTVNESDLAMYIQVKVIYKRSFRVRLALVLMMLAARFGGFGFEAEEGTGQ